MCCPKQGISLSKLLVYGKQAVAATCRMNILEVGQPTSPKANRIQTRSFAGPLDHRGAKIGTNWRA
jgi:hypothetical protein